MCVLPTEWPRPSGHFLHTSNHRGLEGRRSNYLKPRLTQRSGVGKQHLCHRPWSDAGSLRPEPAPLPPPAPGWPSRQRERQADRTPRFPRGGGTSLQQPSGKCSQVFLCMATPARVALTVAEAPNVLVSSQYKRSADQRAGLWCVHLVHRVSCTWKISFANPRPRLSAPTYF